MTALVWGACGFIGQSLVARLLAEGTPVSVLTRPRRLYPLQPWGHRVKWFEMEDAQDRHSMLEACRSADVIYNLAGASGAVSSNREPVSSLDLNCRVQLDFLDCCASAGHRPRVVYASSRLVYSEAQWLPVSEDHPTQPLSMYGVHKLAVENYLRIYEKRGSLSAVILRISNPYGPDAESARKSYGFVNILIDRALRGLPLHLFGPGNQLRDYLYIDDLIDGMIAAGTAPSAAGQTVNIGLGSGITIREAAREMQRLTGCGIVFSPWPSEYELVESGDFVSGIAKAGHLLGFRPRYSFTNGVERTITDLTSRRPEACQEYVAGAIQQFHLASAGGS